MSKTLHDWCKENNRQGLLDEWDYDNNGHLYPSAITCFSNKKVWWKAKCGHGWDAPISYRTKLNCNCPYCSGKRVLPGFNDLQTKFPDIAKEWHPIKNGSLKASDVTAYSKKKVWWICKFGHEWESIISNRTGKNKRSCPCCSGKNVISRITDLQSNFPELAEEWHPTRNGSLKPTDITAGSNKKVWWLGKCGHEWQAAIADRTRGRGCAYCANKKLLSGFNDLQTNYPDIAKEWHPTKNNGIKPSDILFGSHKKVWWKCQVGHEWYAEVRSRSLQNTGCPFCSGRNVVLGINDLQTKCPELILEWNWDKNCNLKPTDVAFSSNEKVWWKCTVGHEWKTAICHRTGTNKTGCPYCSNKKIIPGFNDLASIHPELVNEWNYEKNKNLIDSNGVDISTPDKVSPVSGKSVWWICDKGHEWKTKISDRVHGNSCPLCSKAGTSMPEQGLAFYLEKVCRIEQRCKIAGKEIDVYLPEYKIGIEYDGMYYHKSVHSHKETEKDRRLYEEGIQVIRIKESDTNRIDEKCIYFDFDNMHSNYEWALNQLCQLLLAITGNKRFISVSINAQRDLLKIRERIDLYTKSNSLSVIFPDTAKEWDYAKNGKLTPEMFTIGSDVKVWWKCSKGHSWQTTISHRTSRGHSCPYCSERRMLKGYNDFESWCLANGQNHLLAEWDYEKNDKEPSAYYCKSSYKAWWKCDKGHEWQTRISQRNKGHGCPKCAHDRLAKANSKSVKCIETAIIYPSAKEASEQTQINKACILLCCNKKHKTAGGYHWEYV